MSGFPVGFPHFQIHLPRSCPASGNERVLTSGVCAVIVEFTPSTPSRMFVPFRNLPNALAR